MFERNYVIVSDKSGKRLYRTQGDQPLQVTFEVGTRRLDLLGGDPCPHCSRPPRPEERVWSVRETNQWGYSWVKCRPEEKPVYSAYNAIRLLIEHVSLFEAQAVYAATLQSPVMAIPREAVDEILTRIVEQAKAA